MSSAVLPSLEQLLSNNRGQGTVFKWVHRQHVHSMNYYVCTKSGAQHVSNWVCSEIDLVNTHGYLRWDFSDTVHSWHAVVYWSDWGLHSLLEKPTPLSSLSSSWLFSKAYFILLLRFTRRLQHGTQCKLMAWTCNMSMVCGTCCKAVIDRQTRAEQPCAGTDCMYDCMLNTTYFISNTGYVRTYVGVITWLNEPNAQLVTSHVMSAHVAYKWTKYVHTYIQGRHM